MQMRVTLWRTRAVCVVYNFWPQHCTLTAWRLRNASVSVSLGVYRGRKTVEKITALAPARRQAGLRFQGLKPGSMWRFSTARLKAVP
jgi:hypothetical protein